MGKQRRVREKYHIACKQTSSKNVASSESESGGTQEPPIPWKICPNDNPFAGIDIDVADLSKMEFDNADDDVKSVRSISKTIKSSVKQSNGKLMKKQDKMKLRHHLFIEKIDAVYKKLAEFKKKKPRAKVTMRDVVMDEAVPPTSKVEFLLNKKSVKVAKERPISKKSKGIKKASQRTKQLLNDLQAFKKAISKKPSGNPMDLITHVVEEKVFGGSI